MSGQICVGGEWRSTTATFSVRSVGGRETVVSAAGQAEVDEAGERAWRAFLGFRRCDHRDRAALLRGIATRLEGAREELISAALDETGYALPRVQGEFARTGGQLRYFADLIERDDFLDLQSDAALPDRQPLPRPALRSTNRAIGPVVAFGAANFPFALSVAGGDSASAFAAGCPVLFKAHPAQPRTAELAARAVTDALEGSDIDPAVFSFLQAEGNELGVALVTHPSVKAVAFTGSLAGGRALFDICARRPEPIPFFGELGSVNPMFLTAAAIEQRGSQIADGWVASLTLGAGQFCTNPGLCVLPSGRAGDQFVERVVGGLGGVDPQVMLTARIACNYEAGRQAMESAQGVRVHLGASAPDGHARPALYEVDAATFLSTPSLADEVFGPLGVVVRVADEAERTQVAESLVGQLTCTIHHADEPLEPLRRLLDVLELKAGRIVFNGFPTGVEVCDSTVHGGPYPATTNPFATSIGGRSIRRFLRPVCYQNAPDGLCE